MDKAALAAYLVSLNSLMESQEATAVPKSRWLVEEYTKTWDQLQKAISDEAGSSKTHT